MLSYERRYEALKEERARAKEAYERQCAREYIQAF